MLEPGYYCPRGVYYPSGTFFTPGSMGHTEAMEQFDDRDVKIWANHLFLKEKNEEQRKVIGEFLGKKFYPMRGVIQKPRAKWDRADYLLADPKLDELTKRYDKMNEIFERFKSALTST